MSDQRSAFRQWLSSVQCTWMITHNFGYGIRQHAGDRLMKDFYNRVMREAYGRNWPRRPAGDWIIAIGFWEKLDLNPHAHCELRVPPALEPVLRGPAVQYWAELAPRGHLLAEPLCDEDRVSSYITKRVRHDDDFDRMFIYTRSNDRPSV